MHEKRLKFFSILLICIFILGTLIYGIIILTDEDPTYSESEKRELAQLPQFSLAGFLDGSYIKDLESALSDTFPLRDMWIDRYNSSLELITIKNNGGETIEEIEENGETDDSEPAVDMEELAKSLSTPFTYEGYEQFGQGDNFDGIVISGNRASELFTGTLKNAENMTTYLKYIKSKCPNNRIISCIVPTAVAFFDEDKYNKDNHDQKAYLELISSNLPDIICPDIYSALYEHKDEYIYFRTDHHWTADGAFYAYKAICEELGIKYIDRNSFNTGSISGHYGSLYNQTGNSILKNNVDTINYYYPIVSTSAVAYKNRKALDNLVSINVIEDTKYFSNKYYVFVEGDNPYMEITTGAAGNKTLVILKDSFVNSLIPFLCNHYSKIYVIDPRHVNTTQNNQFNLFDFLKDKEDCDILLCIYTRHTYETSSLYKGLLRLIK